MKRIEVKLNLGAVAPLLDVMKVAADDLEPALAIEASVPSQDTEFAASWRAELLDGQRSDLALMLGMFDVDFFATGVLALDPTNAEPILRACTAIRLRLRVVHLQGLDDEQLETGSMTLESLSELQSRAFAAYAFLATLQELIVQHLDPSSSD
ncbi:MAG: hypothetical protein Q8J74_04765 [Candidatus Didemnitutus sp.]|nr:hypothetical protein [Candidatus Didemnitutus sp.]